MAVAICGVSFGVRVFVAHLMILFVRVTVRFFSSSSSFRCHFSSIFILGRCPILRSICWSSFSRSIISIIIGFIVIIVVVTIIIVVVVIISSCGGSSLIYNRCFLFSSGGLLSNRCLLSSGCFFSGRRLFRSRCFFSSGGLLSNRCLLSSRCLFSGRCLFSSRGSGFLLGLSF